MIGPRGVPVAENGKAVRQLPDLVHLHPDRDRAAEPFFRYPQRGKELLLPLGRGAAMAAHRVYHEGSGAEPRERRDNDSGQGDNSGDAAASAGDGNRLSRPDFPRDPARRDERGQGFCGRRERLAGEDLPAESHMR